MKLVCTLVMLTIAVLSYGQLPETSLVQGLQQMQTAIDNHTFDALAYSHFLDSQLSTSTIEVQDALPVLKRYSFR